MENNQPVKTNQGDVYLIHFDSKLHHAQHYIGWARNVEARFSHHVKGTGAKILAAVGNHGIKFSIVRIWNGETKSFERTLKNRKKARVFCPICSPKKEKEVSH